MKDKIIKFNKKDENEIIIEEKRKEVVKGIYELKEKVAERKREAAAKNAQDIQPWYDFNDNGRPDHLTINQIASMSSIDISSMNAKNGQVTTEHFRIVLHGIIMNLFACSIDFKNSWNKSPIWKEFYLITFLLRHLFI